MLGFGLYFSNIKQIAKLSDSIKNRKVPVDFQECYKPESCSLTIYLLIHCYNSSDLYNILFKLGDFSGLFNHILVESMCPGNPPPLFFLNVNG